MKYFILKSLPDLIYLEIVVLFTPNFLANSSWFRYFYNILLILVYKPKGLELILIDISLLVL